MRKYYFYTTGGFIINEALKDPNISDEKLNLVFGAKKGDSYSIFPGSMIDGEK